MSGKAKAAMLRDGSLDVQISREKSQGELTMTDFIQKHMGEILRPFAEHVDQLHKAVGSLGDELQENNEKTAEAQKQLTFHQSVMASLRDDHERTTAQAKATQAALEQTNSEKTALEADHRETKLSLDRVSNRLSQTMNHVESLQGQVDKTSKMLGKVEQDLAETKQHITTDLEMVLKTHGDDIVKLQCDQEATSNLLTETTMFGERVHKDFLIHVDERAKLNRRDQETFDHIHGQMAHMSTMLNENINRVGLHANHLKTTNGLVRPLKSTVEELVNSTHVLQVQQRDTSTHVEHVQAFLGQLDSDFKTMKGMFGGQDKGPDLYHNFSDLETKVKKNQTALFNIEETLKGHNESITHHDRRVELLEDSTSTIQRQTKNLQDQVGIESAPPPPMPTQAPRASAPRASVTVAQPEATLIPEPKSAKGMGALAKFQSAVDKLSIKEAMRTYKKRLDGHDQELAGYVLKLQEQKHEMELKTQKMSLLERDLINANKVIEDLKTGLELTEEYWKGLSGGFRETHKTVNINNELLPPKGNVTLPALQTPRSGRASLR
jgi:chromosome segregation ATPase